MSITELRQELHKYIETASEQDLQEVFSFLRDKDGVRYKYSEAELKEFYERRKKNFEVGNPFSFLNNPEEDIYSDDDLKKKY